MAYFPDLSVYSYLAEESGPKVLNVGWLSDEELYEQGAVSAEFLAVLRDLLESPVNLCKGHHHCEFCPRPKWTGTESRHFKVESLPGTTSNGEIRVPGRDGIVYAAPALIGHYITEHRYLPPPEFIEAVLRSVSLKD